MRCLKMPAICVVALVVAIGLVQGQQPTSFNFDGIRYTFYPGEVARTWTEANAFCKSLGKELAIFADRAQIRNVSEYLSAEGGVWTGYKTNADCKFEAAELADFEWKKEFGTPIATKAKPKQCGLLSVANYTGIIPTECSTKKAALCSLSNPDAVEAEEIRDSATLAPKPSAKVSNGTTSEKAPAPVTKSAGAPIKPAKEVPAEKEKESGAADAKPKGEKATPAKPAAKATEKSSPEEADKKALPEKTKKSTVTIGDKSSAEVKPSADQKKQSGDVKKPVAADGDRKAGGGDSDKTAGGGDSDKQAGGGDSY